MAPHPTQDDLAGDAPDLLKVASGESLDGPLFALASHAGPPFFRYLLALSTTLGRHSSALTSCQSPVVGSCSFIHLGSSDQRITKPMRAAFSKRRRRRPLRSLDDAGASSAPLTLFAISRYPLMMGS